MDNDEVRDVEAEKEHHPPGNPTPLFVRSSLQSLASTSAAPLLSKSPIKSSFKPPAYKTTPISPKKPGRYAELLQTPIHTAHEANLRDALLESRARDETRKEAMVMMQAGVVLSNMYTSQVQKQLQAHEQKKSKGKTRLLGDGKAQLLSGDSFFNLVVEDEEKRKEEAAQKEKKKESRMAYAEELQRWEAENEGIKARNAEKKKRFDEAETAWQVEKALAKTEKRRPKWNRPQWRKDYQPEKLRPRPKLADVEGEGDETDSNEGSDEE
ncbi:hypothetical protein K435DRAFT_687176 [Dendrothele bispora CBS 962.96]|uniref:Uncharacterized protein n=1 Tax=Dendrothele bispora (strain CBS 962.96) TaxID=1314807 RepID=A0A4S8L860_DENBC|nr:hypothetical protein K435DRAFT_687176 [Dendrothele bispora CBS 962.96]